jgi:glycosyltransferase involved in cell wall biosynthesis
MLDPEVGMAERPVAVLIASYAPSLWTFRRHLIAALKKKGYRVIACAPAHGAALEMLSALEVEFVAVGPARTSLNPLRDAYYLCELIRLCRRVRPAAVISYTAKPVIWGSLAARWAGVRNVVGMVTGLGFAFTESGASRSWAATVVERLYRIALRRCDSVIFQNPDDQKVFIDRHVVSRNGKTFVVNGSGVDLAEFPPTELPATPVFLLVSRILADKGIREYCQAAAIIKRRRPEASFRLVGWFDRDNPRAISPEELAAWCASGIVEYRGAVEDVRPEIAQCRVYVLPSYREGTPRTVLEAMAMGRPIITTDAPGCRETVRPGWNGYLVPVRDSSALAAAMESFLLDRNLAEAMGANSRRLAESRYDGWQVAESILSGAGL